MRVVALALVLLGLVGGCASGGAQYSSQAECERAGRTWNGTSSVCM